MTIDDVLTLKEAAKLWDRDDSTLRKAIHAGRFQEGEYRKAGEVYIVTKQAMERVYGELKK